MDSRVAVIDGEQAGAVRQHRAVEILDGRAKARTGQAKGVEDAVKRALAEGNHDGRVDNLDLLDRPSSWSEPGPAKIVPPSRGGVRGWAAALIPF